MIAASGWSRSFPSTRSRAGSAAGATTAASTTTSVSATTTSVSIITGAGAGGATKAVSATTTDPATGSRFANARSDAPAPASEEGETVFAAGAAMKATSGMRAIVRTGWV